MEKEQTKAKLKNDAQATLCSYKSSYSDSGSEAESGPNAEHSPARQVNAPSTKCDDMRAAILGRMSQSEKVVGRDVKRPSSKDKASNRSSSTDSSPNRREAQSPSKREGDSLATETKVNRDTKRKPSGSGEDPAILDNDSERRRTKERRHSSPKHDHSRHSRDDTHSGSGRHDRHTNRRSRSRSRSRNRSDHSKSSRYRDGKDDRRDAEKHSRYSPPSYGPNSGNRFGIRGRRGFRSRDYPPRDSYRRDRHEANRRRSPSPTHEKGPRSVTKEMMVDAILKGKGLDKLKDLKATGDMDYVSEKSSELPLDQRPSKKASERRIAEMSEKAQAYTGVALPKYYNPAAVNPLKYAEQMQKRKLLWQGAKEKGVSNSMQQLLAATSGEKGSEKFRKLLGVKDEETLPGPSHSTSTTSAKDIMKDLDHQYEVARVTTHTARGYGLGFSSKFAEVYQAQDKVNPAAGPAANH